MARVDRRHIVMVGLLACTAMMVRLDGRSGQGVDSPTLQAVVFTRDIAPILYEHCTGCHYPGGAGPFSLLTYDDVRPRAKQIADVVRRRLMPPWKPEPGYGGPFVGERRLNDEELTRIQQWVENGAAPGNAVDLPQLPVVHRSGWQMGVPDLVITMPQPYLLPGRGHGHDAHGDDVLRNFVIPIPGSETRFVKGVEFQPGNHRVAHHANLRLDQTNTSRRLDERDPEPGYTGVIAPTAAYPDGYFLAWTPGQVRPFLPPDMSWRLEPGSNLVVQMHMVPTDAVESVQVRVGFYFTDIPPTRKPVAMRLGRQSIDIPPGETDYVISDRYVLPVGVEVHSVQPHAHYLAREMKAFATLPDGTRRWLLYIKDWDFHWQDVYRYRDPLVLPKDTILQMEYRYDNSVASPRRPNMSVTRVLFGQQASDEMGDLWIEALPSRPQDLPVLTRDYLMKARAEDIVGYRAMLQVAPDDASLHDGIASSYLGLGRINEAISHVRESVRLQPDSDVAHYNLGTALERALRFDEAAGQFRQAIQLNPAAAYAHNSLGGLLLRMGRPGDAISEFRAAVRIEPLYANAHNNLGAALQAAGSVDAAVEAYQQALRIRPHDPDPQYNLANALRLRGDFDGAIRAYRRTFAIEPDHKLAPFALGTLFEAEARYAEAVDCYRQALAVSPGERSSITRLAWILATAPDDRVRNPREALPLAERAFALSGSDDPVALDVLAAAYAADDRFDLAIATAQRAVDALVKQPETPLVMQIRDRLRLYRGRNAYRAPGSTSMRE